MLDKASLKEILSARFINDKCTKISEIPRPCDLKDTKKSAIRIKQAIKNNERILVVGDYDVDGIISCVIMQEFLNFVGANFVVEIPNRFKHGYGLNPDLLSDHKDATLIITLDNGISAIECAKICKEQNIDLIITDHHCIQDTLPDAYAIINPKQINCPFPDVEICGAQVGWYLIGAIKEEMGLDYDMSSLIDLLIIAIIADMMELRDLNRAILKFGIKRLNSSKRVFLKAIREYFFKKEFDFEDISFLLAPLINSTGRMDDGFISYKFLCSKDIREANKFLDQIINCNELRKLKEKEIFENSLEILQDDDNEIIVVWGDGWHEGVVGIVASRLTRHFKKPSIVLSINNNIAKGSARSIGKFDILELIAKNKDLLITYGGHKGAAGVSIAKENLVIFKDRINKDFKQLNQKKFEILDEVIGEFKWDEIDEELLEILKFYEPYGHKNPKPAFLIKNLTIINIKTIGKDNNHLKLILEHNGICKEALFFNYNQNLAINQKISVIANIIKNSYKSTNLPEILIQDIL